MARFGGPNKKGDEAMHLKASIKKLPEDGLFLVYQDAVQRIGSHTAGSDPDPEYIKKQKKIISMVQDELLGRTKTK